MNILKIADMFELVLFKFYFKYTNGTLPSPLLNLNFPANAHFHSYFTRNRHKLATPAHKNNLFTKSIRHSMISFINELEISIKDKITTHSLQNLVTRFKKSRIEKYEISCSIARCYVCQISH